MASTSSTSPDTLVTLKINFDGTNRRFKLPLRDLGASTFADKLRLLLAIPPTSEAIFERYSDSAAAFVTLDSENISVYKQLYRAAKAKQKLRLKATVVHKHPNMPRHAFVEDEALGTTEQVEAHHYPSPPASPPVVQSKHADSWNEEISSPSVAEIRRNLEDLLTSRDASQADASSKSVTADFSAETHGSASSEIPVTYGQAARERFFAELAGINTERRAALRAKCGPPVQQSTYSVYCNSCQNPIPDQHYHCSICDDGDFDLCQACVDDGNLCSGEGHWLIKRFVQNGKVINSTTEILPPKNSIADPKATLESSDVEDEEETRTCNSCIQELPERNFVTCTTCSDYDLCIPCHMTGDHGHHPRHAFVPVVGDVQLTAFAKALLQPGRNASHQAICDGCDKMIYGVRHKCLDCPDWDYCSECIVNAAFIHPHHRFAPLYEPLGEMNYARAHFAQKVRHHGIYCDGPLCNRGGAARYIMGDRYKCAVCHDTDFCANCEASPSNSHNKTHPLIKFRTPVRNVSVTTMGDHDNGQAMPLMGDRRASTLSRATETTPAPLTNAATQVQTVADFQPSEARAEELEAASAEITPSTPAELKSDAQRSVKNVLVARFVRDTIQDGTLLPPNSVFEQTWVLRNDGNAAWPAGCTVKFVGGDNMCALDPEHPASVHELVSATESTTCYTEVGPGQEFGFTVLMRTPSRPGKVISYWRLTGPSGHKFGHKLWCDVTVPHTVKPEQKEEPVAEPIEEAKEEDKSEAEHSHMIFPKLENESPLTSVHQELPPVESSAVADELTDEDFESAGGFDDETEDGFLTDEEYDILDASDEEYLVEQDEIAKK